MKLKLRNLALLPLLALAACAHSPIDEPSDPLEKINRPIFAFNRTADKYVLRPVARGYVKVVPGPVRTGVSNVFDNLTYPTVIINDVLQAKFVQSGRDLGRFLLNTTAGMLGIMDVATAVGLTKNDEDFGQTLGYWGVGTGWYLMLPLLGPSTNRDLVGRGGDYFTGTLSYLEEHPEVIEDRDVLIATGVSVIDTRARLLDADRMLDQQLDPYLFLRSAYLQQRQGLVYDGNPPQEEFDFSE